MRFATILSTALLVGVVAAAPTYDSSSSSSSSGSGYDSSSSSSGYDNSKSSSSSSSSGYNNNNSGYNSGSQSSSSSSGSYGSSNSGSYGNSNYGYGSSDSSSSVMSESSTQMQDATSTAYYQSSSTSVYQATSTADATSVSTSYASQSTYGSGSSNWGGSGYNDCVQQCIASYGAPAATWTPSSSSGNSDSGSYSGSKGTGATHTVIVAPTQGVLRYVPFAVNASVGDTVMYVWGAKNHTVTKSSQLELCNKTSDAPFASGEQNAPFTFTQVVNDTNPTFFYCGTPGHCQKGMFGIINPPSIFNAATSVSQAMSPMVANSSSLSAMMTYTNNLTQGNDKAASWGQNIDLANLPDWSHSFVAENVMYTRAFLGANPETIKDDGSVDLSGSNPRVIPTDMATVNNAVNAQSAPSSASAESSTAAAASTSAAAAAASSTTNGASSSVASTALLGVAAIAAALLAL